MILWGPPGTGKTTLARLVAQGREGRVRRAVGGACRHQGHPRRGRAGAQPARHARHRAVPRRGASLQQVAAGHVPAVRRGRHADLRRRDHRKSVVRSEQRAAVAGAGVRAEAARLRRISANCSIARSAMPSAVWAACELQIEPGARELLLAAADGDARRMLNLLETAADLSVPAGAGHRLDVDTMRAVIGSTYVRFDKGGENFYDQISALHKSVRGSDPDAALYWLCRMLAGGCDPLYIARRALRMASEDIGNADPRALTLDVWRPARCTSAWAARRASSPSRRPSCSWPARRRATPSTRAYNAAKADADELGIARGAAAPAQCADPAHEGNRLRQGLSLRARRAGRAMPPASATFPTTCPTAATTCPRRAGWRSRSARRSRRGARATARAARRVVTRLQRQSRRVRLQ